MDKALAKTWSQWLAWPNYTYHADGGVAHLRRRIHFQRQQQQEQWQFTLLCARFHSSRATQDSYLPALIILIIAAATVVPAAAAWRLL